MTHTYWAVFTSQATDHASIPHMTLQKPASPDELLGPGDDPLPISTGLGSSEIQPDGPQLPNGSAAAPAGAQPHLQAMSSLLAGQTPGAPVDMAATMNKTLAALASGEHSELLQRYAERFGVAPEELQQRMQVRSGLPMCACNPLHSPECWLGGSLCCPESRVSCWLLFC